jgi:hypothetical protein
MSRQASEDTALEAEIRRLPDLGLDELRARWKTLFGHPAPKSLRRDFLARAVAYQMQVEAYGGLSETTKRRLREIAAAVRRGDADAAGIGSQTRPGTQMIRQWKDKTHTVTALSDGFEWDGRVYKSLSAIAKAITGTNWNGYAFFGIKRAPLGNKNAAGSRRNPSLGEQPSPDVQVRPLPPKLRGGRRHA